MVKKKLIISSILIFLIIQYIALAVVEAGGAAFWPAFTLPGFKKVYGANERIEYTRYSLVASKNHIDLEYSMSSLWPVLPDVQKRAIFRSAIKKSELEIISVSNEEYEWYARAFGEEERLDELFIRVRNVERSTTEGFPVLATTITDYKIENNETD